MEALNLETDEMEIFDYIIDEGGYIVSDYDVEPFTIISAKEGKVSLYLRKMII